MKNYKHYIEIEEGSTVYTLVNEKTGEVFTGKAKCNSCDKNNYNLGIAIAKNRAHLQRCQAELQEVYDTIDKLNEALKAYQKVVVSLEYEQESREDKLDELIYSGEE